LSQGLYKIGYTNITPL